MNDPEPTPQPVAVASTALLDAIRAGDVIEAHIRYCQWLRSPESPYLQSMNLRHLIERAADSLVDVSRPMNRRRDLESCTNYLIASERNLSI